MPAKETQDFGTKTLRRICQRRTVAPQDTSSFSTPFKIFISTSASFYTLRSLHNTDKVIFTFWSKAVLCRVKTPYKRKTIHETFF